MFAIYSGEMREVAIVVRELKQYFDIEEPTIVDADGKPLIVLTGFYKFKHGNQWFPITNLLDWTGDYYDHHGELVCTAAQKATALRAVPSNLLAIESYSMYSGNFTKCVEILKHAAMDYYRSIRAYESCDLYRATREFLKPEYRYLVQLSNEDLDVLINNMLAILDIAYPGLTAVLTELASTEYTAYTVIELVSTSDLMVVSNKGDWRIKEWERMVAEQKEQKAAITRDRSTKIDPGAIPMDIIDTCALKGKEPVVKINPFITRFSR